MKLFNRFELWVIGSSSRFYKSLWPASNINNHRNREKSLFTVRQDQFDLVVDLAQVMGFGKSLMQQNAMPKVYDLVLSPMDYENPCVDALNFGDVAVQVFMGVLVIPFSTAVKPNKDGG